MIYMIFYLNYPSLFKRSINKHLFNETIHSSLAYIIYIRLSIDIDDDCARDYLQNQILTQRNRVTVVCSQMAYIIY